MTFVPSRILALLLVTSAAHAEDIKTVYAISGTSATATTTIKSASAEKEKLMRDYLFQKIAEKIKTLPMVTGIEFDNDTKGEVTTTTYTDYFELKRSYPAMIHLSLPTSVTMLVKVEESYRTCKSPAEKAAGTAITGTYDDYRGSGGRSSGDTTKVDCYLGSSVKIRGPFATYGNFASSVNVDRLLKEKQIITFDVSRDSNDKTSLKLASRFSIESELFDANLFKFLQAFNLKIAGEDNKVYTRNNILLGIARILRMNNERVVE